MLMLTSLARADRRMLLNAGNDVQRWWRLVYTVLTGMVELLHVGICRRWYGRQRRCQEDPISPPSSGLKKTTRSSPHQVAQHCPTGSETLRSPKQQIWLTTTLCEG